jgi:hypothetical protein
VKCAGTPSGATTRVADAAAGVLKATLKAPEPGKVAFRAFSYWPTCRMLADTITPFATVYVP